MKNLKQRTSMLMAVTIISTAVFSPVSDAIRMDSNESGDHYIEYSEEIGHINNDYIINMSEEDLEAEVEEEVEVEEIEDLKEVEIEDIPEEEVEEEIEIEVSEPNGMDYRTIKDLDLQSGNSDNYQAILKIKKGSFVKHLGTTNNRWFKVDYNGTIGYIYRGHVTTSNNYESNYSDIKVTKPDGMEYRTIKDLDLQSGNSDNYQAILKIKKGSFVKHLGTTNNRWFKVDYNGTIGYVYRGHVTAPNNYIENYIDIKYTATSLLHMRTGKSSRHRLIAKIPKGRSVELINVSNGWAKVRYGSQEGFVNGLNLMASRPKESKSDNVTLKKTKNNRKRQQLINTSMRLVDKVPYFWGGKSYKTGWNSDWNKLRKITSPGTSNTGKYLPYGLDCSGFIDWAYRTTGLGNVFSKGGTASQWNSSFAIKQKDALPGDLVFKQSPGAAGINHVGIYIGQSTKGEALVVHCSYGRGGVVVTTIENASLRHFRRAKNVF